MSVYSIHAQHGEHINYLIVNINIVTVTIVGLMSYTAPDTRMKLYIGIKRHKNMTPTPKQLGPGGG